MLEHRCLWDSNYSECPERLSCILERCEKLGLTKRCRLIEPRLATHEELLLKHDERHVDVLDMTTVCDSEDELELLSSKYDAIFLHQVKKDNNLN